MSPTDPEEIEKIITTMKSKTSRGIDDINSEFIKKIKQNIKVPLSKLINMSLETGKIPASLKIAKVIPIFKNKSPEEYTNYRPISLLPIMSKILEKVVHKRLYNFMNLQTCNQLYNNQYGFRTKHSTIHAITQLSAEILESFDNNNFTLGVFLDLSKAFDTINHSTLLKKLEHYGIRGVALEWFRNYLLDRKQYVHFNGINSNQQCVTCGVPQGSVLGPLLFIIYTNDLPNALRSSRCILFADDTTIFHSSNDLKISASLISNDLELLTDWFRANKLSLNVTKTNYMIFSKTQIDSSNINLKIGTEHINRVNDTKFLGVYLDSKLNWHTHLNYCRNKLSSGLYAIKNVKNILPTNEMKSLYYTLIHPYLNYGTLLWGSAAQNSLKRIETLQNKALRNITKSNYNDSVLPLYEATKITPLHKLYKIHLAKLMYQHKNNLLPKPLQALYTPNTETHEHNTRHRHDPHIIRHRTHLVSKTFIHKAPEFWYTLPDTVKEATSIHSFKNRVLRHLGY